MLLAGYWRWTRRRSRCRSGWSRRVWRYRRTRCRLRRCSPSEAGSWPLTGWCRFRTGSHPRQWPHDSTRVSCVAELPRGQQALHDTIETSEGLWLTPARALGDDYHTLFPTTEHLKRLAGFGSVAQLVQFAHVKPIRMVSPDMTEEADGQRIAIRPDLVDIW